MPQRSIILAINIKISKWMRRNWFFITEYCRIDPTFGRSAAQWEEQLNIYDNYTNKLKENYDSLKDKIISKLEKLQEDDNDEEVIKRIDETIEKINTESFDTLSYIKLQQLNENL